MATSTGSKAKTADGEKVSNQELEAEIARLREEMAKLAEQIGKTRDSTYSTARQAAAEGMEHLKAQGEAAMEGVRENARDVEQQLSDAVREKPITSLAIAACVGFLFAALTRR